MNLMNFLIDRYEMGSIFEVRKISSQKVDGIVYNLYYIDIKYSSERYGQSESEDYFLENENLNSGYYLDFNIGDFIKVVETKTFKIESKVSFITNSIPDIGRVCRVGLLNDLVTDFLGGFKNFEYSSAYYEEVNVHDEEFKDLKNLYLEMERIFPLTQWELDEERANKIDKKIKIKEVKKIEIDKKPLNEIKLYFKRANKIFPFKFGKILLESYEPDFNIRIGSYYEHIELFPLQPKSHTTKPNTEGFFINLNNKTYVMDLLNTDFSIVENNNFSYITHEINYTLLLECITTLVILCEKYSIEKEIKLRNEIILRVLTIVDILSVDKQFENFNEASKFLMDIAKVYDGFSKC